MPPPPSEPWRSRRNSGSAATAPRRTARVRQPAAPPPRRWPRAMPSLAASLATTQARRALPCLRRFPTTRSPRAAADAWLRRREAAGKHPQRNAGNRHQHEPDQQRVRVRAAQSPSDWHAELAAEEHPEAERQTDQQEGDGRLEIASDQRVHFGAPLALGGVKVVATLRASTVTDCQEHLARRRRAHGVRDIPLRDKGSCPPWRTRGPSSSVTTSSPEST